MRKTIIDLFEDSVRIHKDMPFLWEKTGLCGQWMAWT